MSQTVARQRELTLLDLLDRALNKGVVVWGDVTLSVADVDLVYLGLKLLLTSVETKNRMHERLYQGSAARAGAGEVGS